MALGPTLSGSGGSLRAALIAAALATVVVALGLFSAGVRWGCLAVLVAIAVITSGERRRRGSGWWDIYAVGVGVSVLGAVIAGASDGVGGIAALIGGAVILISCVIGFPPGE